MGSRPRITGGRLRGRVLPVPVPDSARPTSARVREALFSIVGHDLSDQRVLDAFGGSGLLALEAWSRGASVVCIERNPRAAASIRRAAAALDAAVEVRRGDALRLAGKLGPFDGALVDPPYAAEVEPILDALAPAVRHWLVLEADAKTEVPERVGRLALERSRMYGGTAIHLFRVED